MKTKCPKCKGRGRVQLPPTYPPRPTEYTWTDCECAKPMIQQIIESLRRSDYPLAEPNPRVAYRENYDQIKWR